MILVMSLVEPIGDSTEAGAPQSMSGLAGEDFGKTGATIGDLGTSAGPVTGNPISVGGADEL